MKMKKQLSLRKKTAVEQVLLSLYDLEEAGETSGATEIELVEKRKVSTRLLHYANEVLGKEKLIVKTNENKWLLTDKGIEEGYKLVIQQRLYEMYLMYEMEFAYLELKTKDDLNLKALTVEARNHLVTLLDIHDRAPKLLPKTSSDNERGIMINDL